MTTEANTTLDPQVLPSSTPEGPQIIPTHGTPETQPAPERNAS